MPSTAPDPSASGDLEFHNPYRARRRVMAIIGVACLAVAGVCALILLVGGLDKRAESFRSVAVTLGIALAVALAMLFLALVLVFVSRATDAAFDQFRRGEVLADWRYSPEEWGAFLALEQKLHSKGGPAAGLAFIIPVVFILTILTWQLAPDSRSRIVVVSGAVAVGAALFWAITWLRSHLVRKHTARLRRNARVVTGQNAISCGGMLTQWNYGGTVLRRIRIVGGAPPCLEVVTGAGVTPNARRNDFTANLLVPIPAGLQAEAETIVARLQR